MGNHNELVPQFTALATSMIRFGEDKATDGILGVIGLGKKTCYSHRYARVRVRLGSSFSMFNATLKSWEGEPGDRSG